MNYIQEKENWSKAAERSMRWLKNNWIFAGFFCAMAGYYLWRLYFIPPWYDELYTYESFIDRGVIYSMIHWPLPNNHVLYSALSALLNKLGSPYLGLRGVSLLASMAGLGLFYRILKKVVRPHAATLGCALFASMYNVTQQAVQGRGYALSGFFLIAGINLLYEICVPERTGGRRRFWLYAGFAACLTGGLYAIPSNLYWVVPICLAGGLFLLLFRDYGSLFRLIAASLFAALVTFGLYTIIWLAIGSNFLVKEAGGPFYGMSHFQMLLSDPFAAFSRGMQAMLSDPNIQSVEREQFWAEFAGYLSRLMDQVYPSGSRFLLIVIILALMAAAALLIVSLRKREKGLSLLCLYCLVLTVMVPIFLIVQCVFPYLRVFTYMGSVLAMLFVLTMLAGARLLQSAFGARRGRAKPAAAVGQKRSGMRTEGVQALLCAALSAFLAIGLLSRPSYQAGYDSRDNHICAALKQLDIDEVDTVMVGDVYARLNLYFHIERCQGKQLVIDEEQPDYVLMDKIQAGPEGEALIWPYDRNTQDFPWEWIEGHMEVVFEDDAYIAYQVKKEETQAE